MRADGAGGDGVGAEASASGDAAGGVARRTSALAARGMTAPLRLRLDGDALVANWRALARMSGAAACGAAVKADGYGLGAREVVDAAGGGGVPRLLRRDLGRGGGAGRARARAVSVLHGVRDEDMAASALPGRAAGAQHRRRRSRAGARRAAARAT